MFTIQCDFDDTITVGNVSVALREAFALEQWKQIEAKYVAGQFSVEESNRRQFALIRTPKTEPQNFVRRTTEVRPGFPQFVEYCRNTGIGFTVVSSGLDLYIQPVLRNLGLSDLETYSGRARVTSDGIVVDYVDPWGTPREEGFKLACLKYLRQRGWPVIYIGDGTSDVAAALEAEFVLARDSLKEQLSLMSRPHFTFDDFHDVRKIVENNIR